MNNELHKSLWVGKELRRARMNVKLEYVFVVFGVVLGMSCGDDSSEPIGTEPDLSLLIKALGEPAEPPFDEESTECVLESPVLFPSYRFGVMDRALYEDPELRRIVGFARTNKICERGYRMIRAKYFVSGLRSGKYQECRGIDDFEDCEDFAEEFSELICPDFDYGGVGLEVTNELETVRVECSADGEVLSDETKSTPGYYECSGKPDTIVVSSPGFESVTLDLAQPVFDACGKPRRLDPFTFPADHDLGVMNTKVRQNQ